jgi:hypothetical protein
MTSPVPAKRTRILVIGLWCAVAGGLIDAAAILVGVPPGLLIVGLILAVFGTLVFFGAVWRDGRESGIGFLRATGRAIRMSVKFAFEMFP